MNPDNAEAIHKTSLFVATAATSSPLWVQHLSEVASTWLPIVGFAFLILQAGVYVYKNFIRKKPTV